MKKPLVFLSVLLTLNSFAVEVEKFEELFSKGSIHGNIKYYFIETNKENSATDLSTRAYAHSLGGKLNYTTAEYKGVSAGVSFMTTNPFSLPQSVDTSIIARDDGIRLTNSASGDIAQKGFFVLGESFIKYRYENLQAWYGRKLIKTPLIHEKDVRMIPSAVEGGDVSYAVEEKFEFGLSYYDKFKQRTSSKFINIIEHALGSDTKEITGRDGGHILPVYLIYKPSMFQFQFYNYYAKDFMNSMYLDAQYKNNTTTGLSYSIAVQALHQQSIGHSKEAMNNNALAYGGEINSGAIGAKLGLGYKESWVDIAYSNVFDSSDNEHNSLVTPWDGTPLFTNTLTSSNLFSSNYAKGLSSAGGYIAGTQGLKLSYKQTYKFISIKGVKSIFTYARFKNSDFAKTQEDMNAVLGYTLDKLSISLKGIWVKNSASNSSSDTAASISQLDRLRQYRVIANYKF